MFDLNNKEIAEGQYLKVIGCKVKNDNGIYIVNKKYSEDSFCLYKVLQNGEESKTKYNIYFLDFKRDKDRQVTIISKDELKQAANEVKAFVDGVTSNELVYSFTRTAEQEVKEGLYVKFIKHILLTGHINSFAGTYEIDKIDKENRMCLHLVGERGEKVAYNVNNQYQGRPIILSFKNATVQKLFSEKYIEILERHESTKGEQKKEIIKEEKTEQKQEVEQQYTITEDVDTRDNSKIWCVKLTETLSTDEYREVSNKFKKIQGYYSRFKHSFIFKYDPTDVLNTETEQEEQNNMNNEQEEDILSKFDNVEVKNTSRISEKDEEFCKDHEMQYKEFITFANKYMDYLENNKLNNRYFYSTSLTENMFNKMRDIKCSFIENIVEYFRKEYKVTLKSETINKKHDINITYDMIVSDIIEQLGGYNFTDKASKEIKDALKSKVKRTYKEEPNATVKNNKVILDDFFYIDSFDKKWGTCKVSYGSDEGFYKLLKAVSHFEQGVFENKYSALYDTITREKDDDVFKTHNLMCIKAESMKVFKNGKVEIIFKTSAYARQFAKEYCGVIEKIA
jgi:hypothetical protein